MQRIKNEFTVTVYEIHARMALEVVRGLLTTASPARSIGFCESKLILSDVRWMRRVQ